MSTNLHLEIQHYPNKPNLKPVGILRSSFRDQNGKIKHQQFGRIIGKTINELQILRLAFQGKVAAQNDPKSLRIIQTKEYGASRAILEIIKDTALDKTIYSRTDEPWVKSVTAMIAGRLIYQGSKLSLSHLYDSTTLWEQVGVLGKVDVDKHCYQPLDQLLKRQEKIQKNLAKAHLTDGVMVLYDITSSYLEGEYTNSSLVKFGYNRDHKSNHPQIVIGLICNKEGCPVAVEVFPGNTKDEATVVNKVKEIKEKYQIEELIFVGDRGMITCANLKKLEDQEDLKTISALTRSEIFTLIKNNNITPSLFDNKKIVEVFDLDNPNIRYCLCRNPIRATADHITRDKLIEKTLKSLTIIKNYKKSSTVAILGARIGKVIAKHKMGKYIRWNIEADPTSNNNNGSSKNHQINFTTNQETIAKAQLLDGCYIISSNIAKETMNAEEIVSSYKKLQLVEQAFRNLKTVQLELRPIYHKKDDRIKAHVFLCMLAYYIEWHINQKLAPLFQKQTKSNQGKNRYWTFYNVIEHLKQITRNKVKVQDIVFYQNSEPTENQQKIIDCLKIKL